MPDAETAHDTRTKLALISERARQEPSCQFTSLAHLLEEGFLEHCYFQLGRDRASGIVWSKLEGIWRVPGGQPAGFGGTAEGEAV